MPARPDPADLRQLQDALARPTEGLDDWVPWSDAQRLRSAMSIIGEYMKRPKGAVPERVWLAFRQRNTILEGARARRSSE